MKLLAFLSALVLCLIILSFFKIRIGFSFLYNKGESKVKVDFNTFFSHWQAETTISPQMVSEGVENLLSNISADISESTGKRPDRTGKKKKTKRYRLFEYFSGELFQRYLSNWSLFLLIKRKITKLKKQFYQKIELHSLNIVMVIGASDAAETGIITGTVWAFLGQMTARIYRNITVIKNQISYSVRPRFDEQIFLSDINCILSLKNSHIIFTAYKLLIIILKNRRTR